MPNITYEQALSTIRAAFVEAAKSGFAPSVAIVDQGRELVAFARQDGATLASIQISIGKAYTACSLGMPTGDLGKETQPGQPLYGLETSHRPSLVTFPGGWPLFAGDDQVGAIGVSGGSVDQDELVAATVAESFMVQEQGG